MDWPDIYTAISNMSYGWQSFQTFHRGSERRGCEVRRCEFGRLCLMVRARFATLECSDIVMEFIEGQMLGKESPHLAL